MKFIKINITENDLGKRIDKFLFEHHPMISRSKFKRLIINNKVTIDSKCINEPSYKISAINTVHLELDYKKNKNKKIEIDLDIIYEDSDIIIIDKLPGILTHCSSNNNSLSIVDILKKKNKILYQSEDPLRDGVVHRLDKDTSGLIIFVKNTKSYNGLKNSFSKREVHKIYNAICWGKPLPIAGTINRPLSDFLNKKKVTLIKKGKDAITEYRVLNSFKNMFSKIECKIITGRTHQIRAHMLSMGCPLLGDKLYAKGRNIPKNISKNIILLIKNIKRQALHAKKITFKHPIKDEILSFESKIANDIKKLEYALFDDPKLI